MNNKILYILYIIKLKIAEIFMYLKFKYQIYNKTIVK